MSVEVSYLKFISAVHLFVAVLSTRAVTSLPEGLRDAAITEVLVYGFGSHRPLNNKTETAAVITGCYVGGPCLTGLILVNAGPSSLAV